MKLFLISTVPMFLLFGAIAPACAQPNHDRQEQGKSEKQRGALPQQQHAQQAPQQERATQSQQQRAREPQQQPRAEQPQPGQRTQQAPQQQRAQQPQPQQRAQQPQPQQERAQQPQPGQRGHQAPQQQRAEQPQPGQRTQQAPQQQRAQQPQPQQRSQQRQQQQHAQQPQQYAQQQPQRTEQQARVWQQQSGWSQQGAWQEHPTWQQGRSSHWQTDHRTWGERGGYGGYYIPQDRFGLYFGAGHWFRIQSQPIIVAGYPRFQYGGYSFMMVDPWPGDWAPNWYATDDVYVGYSNGYYLYNRMHPGEAMAITVML